MAPPRWCRRRHHHMGTPKRRPLGQQGSCRSRASSIGTIVSGRPPKVEAFAVLQRNRCIAASSPTGALARSRPASAGTSASIRLLPGWKGQLGCRACRFLRCMAMAALTQSSRTPRLAVGGLGGEDRGQRVQPRKFHPAHILRANRLVVKNITGTFLRQYSSSATGNACAICQLGPSQERCRLRLCPIHRRIGTGGYLAY